MLKGFRGFSTLELLVSLGLFGILGVFVSQLFQQVDLTQKDTFLRADMEATTAILNSIISKDFIRASPSFNYITSQAKTMVGTSCSNKKLFDIVEKDKACGLKYTIDLDVNKEFHFLVSNDSYQERHDELLFPKDVFTSGKFSKSKLDEFLSVKTKVAFENYLIKAQGADPEYTMLLVAKKSGGKYILNTVNGTNHGRGSIVIPLKFDDTKAPSCAGYVASSNFEQYLRCIDGSPGNQYVLLRPLRFIRYRVGPSRRYEYPAERNGEPYMLMTLFRGSGLIYGNKVEFKEHIISNAVSKFEIYREDTSSPIIQFEAVIEKASFLKNLKRRK